jgi:hypothetical protein
MGRNTFSFGEALRERRGTMKKRARWTLLLLAGALAYFATEKTGTAGCIPDCWESGGFICCTNENCIDYCW